MKFWKRPRTLLLSALLLVAAFMIWKDSQRRADEGRTKVAAWLTKVAEQTLGRREVPPDMGQTPALVRDSLANWLREGVPPDRLPSVSVDVRSERESMFQTDAPPWTHTATVHVGDVAVEVLVVWNGSEASAIGANLVQK